MYEYMCIYFFSNSAFIRDRVIIGYNLMANHNITLIDN